MRDFVFTDPSESTKQVIFRTDAVNAASNNFTILDIIGNDPKVDIYGHDQWKRTALLSFKDGRVTSQGALIEFATQWQLNLVVQDASGANSSTLVDWDSDSSADSW